MKWYTQVWSKVESNRSLPIIKNGQHDTSLMNRFTTHIVVSILLQFITMFILVFI